MNAANPTSIFFTATDLYSVGGRLYDEGVFTEHQQGRFAQKWWRLADWWGAARTGGNPYAGNFASRYRSALSDFPPT